MAHPFGQDDADPLSLYRSAMLSRAGGISRRFDEYYRCYPISMMPGTEKRTANHGGKVFLPASALEKLTHLHITYPMLFELINGAKDTRTHAGVLEFTAEEGRIYLPMWLMQTLLLESGDLIQVKSTDLPPGTFIKLKPQSVDFLDITDPKAVLENAFRHFSCLTVGDIFSFEYNENVYEIEVLEVKPLQAHKAICTMETDLSVDFAPPVGYEEQEKSRSTAMTGSKGGGTLDVQGTMAKAINYAAISPETKGEAATQFVGMGSRLGRKSNKSSGTSTPAMQNYTVPTVSQPRKRRDGPEPLRLGPGKLFFGFPYRPPPAKKDSDEQSVNVKPHFEGMGRTLRGKKPDGKS